MHSLQSPMDKKTTVGTTRNVNVVLTDENVSELSTKLNVDMKEYQLKHKTNWWKRMSTT